MAEFASTKRPCSWRSGCDSCYSLQEMELGGDFVPSSMTRWMLGSTEDILIVCRFPVFVLLSVGPRPRLDKSKPIVDEDD